MYCTYFSSYISGTLRSWGHLRPKISLVGLCMKTNFWWLKSPKIYSLMTKNTKKCKKLSLKAFLAAIGLIWRCKKWSFCINLSDMEVYTGFLTHPRTKPWIFHTPWMSLGLWKILNFEDCLEKFGCINLHVKKSFFYVLFHFDKIIFLNVTLG